MLFIVGLWAGCGFNGVVSIQGQSQLAGRNIEKRRLEEERVTKNVSTDQWKYRGRVKRRAGKEEEK